MGRQIKLLHFSKYFPPYRGGIEQVVYDLCAGQERGFLSQDVLCTNDRCVSVEEECEGYKIFRAARIFEVASVAFSLSLFLCWFRLRKKYDVVHLHLPNPFASFVIFMLPFRGKVVLHWHSDIVKQKKLLWFYKPFQTWLLKRADLIVVTSPEYLTSSAPLSDFKDKCRVVPIGVDSLQGRVDTKLVSKIREEHGSKIVFALGRHVYYKGFEVLIKAAALLPDCKVLIGGSGPDTKKYKELAVECGCEDKVVFVGRISDKELASYYTAARLFCLPSIARSEAFGVVQLEAMALGTPVVSCDIAGSGVSWVNKNYVSGLIAKTSCSQHLAEQVKHILDDDALRATLAQGAIDRYCDDFTADKMRLNMSAVYEELW